MDDPERYRLTTLLGKGAMGEVLRAEDVRLDREVAVKRIDPELEGERLRRRFVEEARITARLDHPGIVPIYSLEKDARGQISYAMKLVRGRTLEDYLAEARAFHAEGKRPTGEHALPHRLEIFLHVLDTIAYAHERGVLHRDLKPENVMVSAHGEVLVMDWGLAKTIGAERDELSTEGQMIGTPAFMSPEQADGQSQGLDARSDLFSLGLVFFEVVTLRHAREGATFEDILKQAISGRREPIRHVSPKESIPRELAAIIRKATEPVRADRYASVADLAADVRRFLHDESVHADPDRGWRTLRRWIGKNRTKTLVALAGLALVGILVAVLLQWRASEALRAQEEAERQRELRLQNVQAVVARQATSMNERLHDFEGIVRALGAEAARVLTEEAPPTSLPIYVYTKAGPEPATAPADAKTWPAYGPELPVSYRQPDLLAADVTSRGAARRTFDRLARLGPALARAQLESLDPRAFALAYDEAERRVLNEGAPLVWTYAATEDGAAVGFPGSWIYEPEGDHATYDPRVTDWYRAAPRDESRSRWLNSGVDESGLGLLITCVRAVHDVRGRMLGVVAADLTFDYFIEQLLEVPAVSATGAETFVVDAEGLVVVRSSDKARARDAKNDTPMPFPDAEVRAAIGARAQGHLARPDGVIALWAPVVSTGWSYVVVGPEADLLAAFP
ncbi:MAG: protein kinase [Deltaproteobacteria bacterium]|nr:protein kinase [Deltaproteobacteria bacterium]